MISKNFFESLEEIAYERGLHIDDVLAKVEVAMAIACKNSDVPYKGTIKIDVRHETKKIRFMNVRYVVEEIDPEGPRGQITLEEAQALRSRVKIGDEIKDEMDLNVFKRKAASLFKQNLLNELKSLEREDAYHFFNEKVGEVITGRVVAKNDKFVTLSLGKGVDATMSTRDMLPDEAYLVGEEKKVYVTRVEKTGKGPKVFVSRANKDIVRKLFEMHIPEIANGQIEIMGIAREPGKRTKIGVAAINEDIDPKGACVGSGGMRIKAINVALDGEKIDIFVWKNNPIELIAEALSPAKVKRVIPDEKNKKATVVVEDDQYSLAIGSKGQNAKLAVMATGWKIDIVKSSEATASTVSATETLGESLAKMLDEEE